jgi:hypothetical protein
LGERRETKQQRRDEACEPVLPLARSRYRAHWFHVYTKIDLRFRNAESSRPRPLARSAARCSLPSSETTRCTKYLTGRFDFLAVTASQGENAAIFGALMQLGEFGSLPERNRQ